MSSINYITDLLGLKDNNIILSENISKTTIKGVTHTVLEGTLSYLPTVSLAAALLMKSL